MVFTPDSLDLRSTDQNASFRSKLQRQRSKLNQEINKELRLRAGAEKLLQATNNRKLKGTISLELSFVNSNLQLLKEQLSELNSSVEYYQNEKNQNILFPMIPLGLKETKDICFAEQFADFILEHYSEDSNKYTGAINELTTLRHACRTPSRDSEGVSMLFSYYNLLYYIERRFFASENNISIYFEWFDSLSGEPSTQRSITFEKACILFNLGAIHTQIGAKQDRTEENGLDLAVSHFLQAAGIFKHIYDTYSNAPSMDMKPMVLDVFVDLMLAQSRECLFEKILISSKSAPPNEETKNYRDLAVEANQLARKYTEIQTSIQSKETNVYLPELWTGLVPFKAEYYKGIAHFYASKAVCEGISSVKGSSMSNQPLTKEIIRLAHLRESVASLEEAIRIQRMSRDLKGKYFICNIVRKALEISEEELSALSQESSIADDNDDVEISSVLIEATSNITLSLNGPDFKAYTVEDPFKSLGPIGVFSARKYWTAPRSIRLQKGSFNAKMSRLRREQTPHKTETSIDTYGFYIRGDAPVLISAVLPNSLAELGGLKEGDYLVEIMGIDVKWYTCQQAAKVINSPSSSLELKVVTPMEKKLPHLEKAQSKEASSLPCRPSSKLKSYTDGSRNRLGSIKYSSWNLFRKSQSSGESQK